MIGGAYWFLRESGESITGALVGAGEVISNSFEVLETVTDVVVDNSAVYWGETLTVFDPPGTDSLVNAANTVNLVEGSIKMGAALASGNYVRFIGETIRVGVSIYFQIRSLKNTPTKY